MRLFIYSILFIIFTVNTYASDWSYDNSTHNYKSNNTVSYLDYVLGNLDINNYILLNLDFGDYNLPKELVKAQSNKTRRNFLSQIPMSVDFKLNKMIRFFNTDNVMDLNFYIEQSANAQKGTEVFDTKGIGSSFYYRDINSIHAVFIDVDYRNTVMTFYNHAQNTELLKYNNIGNKVRVGFNINHYLQVYLFDDIEHGKLMFNHYQDEYKNKIPKSIYWNVVGIGFGGYII